MYTFRTRTPGTTFATIALSAVLATAGLGLFSHGALANEDVSQQETPAAEQAEQPQEEERQAGEEAKEAQPVVTSTALTYHQFVDNPEFDVNRAPLYTLALDVPLANQPQEAAELYEAINAYRAANGVPAMGNDPLLETSAYQRAAEVSVLNANVRPDGTLFDTVDGYDIIFGEIAVTGNKEAELDAAAVLETFKASDQAWMLLDSAFIACGVSSVQDAAGNTYWVLLFSMGTAPLDYEATPVEEGDATYYVRVASVNLTVVNFGSDLALEVGGTKRIPMPVTTMGEMPVGAAFAPFTGALYNLSARDYTWNSSDPAVATADGGIATGLSVGTCVLSAANVENAQFLYNTTVGGGVVEPEFELAECTIAGILGPYEATGAAQTPAFTVIDPNGVLVEPSQYTYEYANNVEPGTATLTVTAVEGSPAVSGSAVKTFQITAVQVPVPAVAGMYPDAAASALEAAGFVPYLAEGEAAPDPASTGIVYATNPQGDTAVDAGSTVTLYYYAAPVATPAEPAPGDESADDQQEPATEGEPEDDPEGNQQEPAVEPQPEDDQQEPGTDAQPEDAQGTPETDEPAGDEGNPSEPADVDPAATDLAEAGFSIAPIDPMVLGDAPCEPTVIVLSGSTALIQGVDYTVGYANNAEPGVATATAKGVGEYGGTLTAEFQVLGDLTTGGSVMPIAGQEYTGLAATPELTVAFGDKTLVEGTDYTVEYANNVNVSTAEAPATATVTGTGSYTGSFTASFAITPASIRGAQVSPVASVVYSGFATTPEVTVTLGSLVLSNGVDYTVAYENNVDAGTAHVVITGTGNYCDFVDTTFVIAPMDIAHATVVMPNVFYTGQSLAPVPVSVTIGGKALELGVDYTVADYANNVEPGDAIAVIKGTGNYGGSVNANWKVVRQSSSGTTESGTTQTLPATGDSTNTVALVIVCVVGFALVVAAVVLIVRGARRNANGSPRPMRSNRGDYEDFDEYR